MSTNVYAKFRCGALHYGTHFLGPKILVQQNEHRTDCQRIMDNTEDRSFGVKKLHELVLKHWYAS